MIGMPNRECHPADEQLLLFLDGEAGSRRSGEIRTHLEQCWECRARLHQFEDTIDAFLRQRELETSLPPSDGPRALLKAQLSQLAGDQQARPSAFVWAVAGVACAVFFSALLLVRSTNHASQTRTQSAIVSIPNSTLTPGTALLENQRVLCSQVSANNKAVPVPLQKKVFEEYGIAGADPRAYEVDYLVTPALGGTEDIHNLWPHSYSAAMWNARVKDALEDRLHEMVCDGSLDLHEAQQEIATDWISAYKKYFRTDKPLPEHSNHRQE